MSRTLAACGDLPWPHAECVRDHRNRPPRPPLDPTGLVLSDGDSDEIARLAQVAVTAAFAVAGGVIALSVGVLRNLLGGR